MKLRFLSAWRLPAVLALPLLMTAPSPRGSEPSSGTEVALPGGNPAEPDTNVSLLTAEPLVGDDQADAQMANAAVTPLSPAKPLPPNIRPSSPTGELIKLANSGLDQRVLLAFVNNCTGTFNLDADKIIYLNDIGVPAEVVTAMIQRDQQIRAASDTAVAAATAPPPVAPSAEAPAPTVPVEAPMTPPEEVTDSDFYNSLAPYGNWVDVSGYGPCWQPSVVVINPGWQPYFDCGHWAYTDCGWYWCSDYTWGWAPFHYGRWFRHSHLGWCWRPDHVWGPSWVCWRSSGDYCGWAPLPPHAGFSAGVGLTFGGHAVASDYHFGLRPEHFHFVAWNHFNDRHLNSYALTPHQGEQVFNHSAVSTGFSVQQNRIANRGIAPERVAAATHSPVRQVSVSATPGGLGVTRNWDRDHGRSLNRSPQIASAPADGNSALVIRGRDQVWPPTTANQGTPASSLVVIGRRDGNQSQGVNQNWGAANSSRNAWIPPRSAGVANQTDVPQENAAAERSQPISPLQSRRDQWMGNGNPRQFPGPSYQGPTRTQSADVPRYNNTAPANPAPSYRAAPMMPARPSYSDPPRSSAPVNATPAPTPSRSSDARSAPSSGAPSSGGGNAGGNGGGASRGR